MAGSGSDGRGRRRHHLPDTASCVQRRQDADRIGTGGSAGSDNAVGRLGFVAQLAQRAKQHFCPAYETPSLTRTPKKPGSHDSHVRHAACCNAIAHVRLHVPVRDILTPAYEAGLDAVRRSRANDRVGMLSRID